MSHPREGNGTMSATRAAEPGLYSADYEHDACGVAFVARLDAIPQHETVERALQALENLEHRGATGADADTGDGAGILLQLPDAFFRAVLDEPLPEPGATASRCASSRSTPDGAASSKQHLVRLVEEEGQRFVSWRDVPVDPAFVGATAGAAAPVIRQLFVAAGDAIAGDQDAFERKLYVIRRRFELEGGCRCDRPELLVPHHRLQGDAHRAAAPRLLPRPPGRAHRVGPGARPLPLLDEHVPELGARAPVPDDRPQRRDQHGPRQHQLDAGARVAARVGAVRRRSSQGASGRAGRRLRLGDVRQRARAPRARRPLAAARDHDDDPRGDRRAH